MEPFISVALMGVKLVPHLQTSRWRVDIARCTSLPDGAAIVQLSGVLLSKVDGAPGCARRVVLARSGEGGDDHRRTGPHGDGLVRLQRQPPFRHTSSLHTSPLTIEDGLRLSD